MSLTMYQLCNLQRELHGLEHLLGEPEDLVSNSHPHRSRARTHIPVSLGQPS